MENSYNDASDNQKLFQRDPKPQRHIMSKLGGHFGKELEKSPWNMEHNSFVLQKKKKKCMAETNETEVCRNNKAMP